MNTYTRNCYTYLIGWTVQNKWYYGAKYGKGANPKTFWSKYKTSSEHVKNFMKIHGEPDVIQIRKTFGEDSTKCLSWETKLLNKIKARSNPNFLNRHNGGTEFRDTNASARLKGTRRAYNLENQYIGRIPCDDPRWKTNEIHDIHLEKLLSSSHKLIGTTAAKLIDGTPIGRIPSSDIRWKTGEIITVQSDIPQVNHRKPIFINGIRYESLKEAWKVYDFPSFPKIARGVYKNGEKYGIFSVLYE